MIATFLTRPSHAAQGGDRQACVPMCGCPRRSLRFTPAKRATGSDSISAGREPERAGARSHSGFNRGFRKSCPSCKSIAGWSPLPQVL